LPVGWREPRGCATAGREWFDIIPTSSFGIRALTRRHEAHIVGHEPAPISNGWGSRSFRLREGGRAVGKGWYRSRVGGGKREPCVPGICLCGRSLVVWGCEGSRQPSKVSLALLNKQHAARQPGREPEDAQIRWGHWRFLGSLAVPGVTCGSQSPAGQRPAPEQCSNRWIRNPASTTFVPSTSGWKPT
jgi:hypothetical protein